MRKISFILWAIILINLALYTFYFAQKGDFHVDEQFSFGHANSTQGAFLSPKLDSYFDNYEDELRGKWLNSKKFDKYLTIQKEEAFLYKNIFENLEKGVHPPLYYIILHTVSSFFPEVFSKWMGYGINVVILAALLWLSFKLANEIFEDERLSYAVIIFCGFSMAVLNMAMFIRMYLLQMFLATFLVYLTLKMLKDEKVTYKRLLQIGIVSFFGFLTHFYSLIFAFFVASSTGLWLLKQKKYNLLLKYCSCMLLSVVAFVVSYPAALNVIFHSQRGAATFATLQYFMMKNFFEISDQLSRISELVLTELFNFKWVTTELFCLLVILFFSLNWLQKLPKGKNSFYVWWIFLFSLAYGAFVALFSPKMFDFDDRYFAPLMVCVPLLIVYGLNETLKNFGIINEAYRAYILLGLVLLNVVNLNFSERSVYTFKQNSNGAKFIKLIKDKPVFLVDDLTLGVFGNIYYLRNAKKVYVTETGDEAEFIQAVKNEKEGYILVYNSCGSYCINCFPQKIEPVSDVLKPKSKYLFCVRHGLLFYDVYEIINE